MSLTIAKPRSPRFDEVAGAAWRQAEPVFLSDGDTTQALVRAASYAAGSRPKLYQRRCRLVAAVLRAHARPISSSHIYEALSGEFPLGERQIAGHLGQMVKDGLIIQAERRHWRDGGGATTWRLT